MISSLLEEPCTILIWSAIGSANLTSRLLDALDTVPIWFWSVLDPPHLVFSSFTAIGSTSIGGDVRS